MKHNNISGGKRKTKKRGGTTEQTEKPKKVVKTKKNKKNARNDAIIARINLYNHMNPTEKIAVNYGLRTFNSGNNRSIIAEQFSDSNYNGYLHNNDLYKKYSLYKELITGQRQKTRKLEKINKQKSLGNTPPSPVASLRQPFIDLDGNPSAYPFSDKKVTDKNEKRLAGNNNFMINSPYNPSIPTDLFNDLNYILPPSPNSLPTEDDSYSDMFDTPKKESPKKESPKK